LRTIPYTHVAMTRTGGTSWASPVGYGNDSKRILRPSLQVCDFASSCWVYDRQNCIGL